MQLEEEQRQIIEMIKREDKEQQERETLSLQMEEHAAKERAVTETAIATAVA